MFKGKPSIVYTDSETYRTAKTGLIYVLQLLHIVLLVKMTKYLQVKTTYISLAKTTYISE